MKNEIHIREFLYRGDRSNPAVGIAHKRLVDKNGKPKKGYFTVWIDTKERDLSHPSRYKLVYPYPFRILCSDALMFPTQYLRDYNHTMLHLIPLSKMAEYKTRRKRIDTQDEFERKLKQAEAIQTTKCQISYIPTTKENIVLSYARDLKATLPPQSFPLF